MVRTVISLDPEEKRWLDRQARRQGVSMNRVVRRAIQDLRKKEEAATLSFEQLLRRTHGVWKRVDALAYQRKLRGEWKRHR